jgi:hypothetical protein
METGNLGDANLLRTGWERDLRDDVGFGLPQDRAASSRECFSTVHAVRVLAQLIEQKIRG